MLDSMLQYECQQVDLPEFIVRTQARALAVTEAMRDRVASGWKLESTAAVNYSDGVTGSLLLFWSKPPDHQTGSTPPISSA